MKHFITKVLFIVSNFFQQKFINPFKYRKRVKFINKTFASMKNIGVTIQSDEDENITLFNKIRNLSFYERKGHKKLIRDIFINDKKAITCENKKVTFIDPELFNQVEKEYLKIPEEELMLLHFNNVSKNINFIINAFSTFNSRIMKTTNMENTLTSSTTTKNLNYESDFVSFTEDKQFTHRTGIHKQVSILINDKIVFKSKIKHNNGHEVLFDLNSEEINSLAKLIKKIAQKNIIDNKSERLQNTT